MYVIEDMDKQIIVGKFYKEELQDIGKTPPEVFRIEKIIKTRGIGKHKQHWVKWVGYNNSHNSWVSAFNLIKT
jgi:hypothetical protein